MSSVLEKFIKGMPKVELHMHIEGSLEPEMMFALAKRNGIDIPFNTVDEVRAAYNFSNLQDFLDIYYQGMNVLQTERDFYDLTMAYLKKCKEQNVTHTEIFFDPQGHTGRGLKFETPLNGITRALRDGEYDLGISSKLIMCFLRHLSEEAAFETLAQALPHKDKIHGVGLDSSENGHPPRKFYEVFRTAHEEGFAVVAHAGEEGPPEYVVEAVFDLHVDRIDHGNRSLEDAQLVQSIRKLDLGLTVCPLSNLKLCGVESLEEHPLKEMLDRGLKAGVNSDDPAYFGGYMNENFIAIAKALKLSQLEILQLAENAIKTSFMDHEEKSEHLRDLYTYARNFNNSLQTTPRFVMAPR